jgi:hypothetical protein
MANKAKQPISIDRELLEEIKRATKDSKGGVSAWINDACKKKVRSQRRANKRKEILNNERRNRSAKGSK